MSRTNESNALRKYTNRARSPTVNAPDRMARQLQRFLGPEHPRAGAELVLALAVVEARVASGAEEEEMFTGTDRKRLGDSPRLDAQRLRRGLNRRRRLLQLDQPKVGRMLGKPAADGLEAHSPTR